MIPNTWFSTPLSKSAKDTEGRIRNIFEGQRRRPAAIVLALVAAVALLCGSVVVVRSRNVAVAPTAPESTQEASEAAARAEQAAQRTPLQEITELPAFSYQGDDPCLAAVCEWSVGEEGAKYLQAAVTIPCPLIADVDDADPQDVRVWGSFNVFNYKPVGTTLLAVSGGATPGLLHLRAAGDGYEVYDTEMVEDGEGYGESMRRIFGTARMKALDAIDADALRTQYIADYVLQNGLPFTQYQDYGWEPVHIPGTPETPEAAQHIHFVSTLGYSIDYDLRELVCDTWWDGRVESLTGVGKLQGVSIRFERFADTDVETVAAEQERQMEQPTQTTVTLGADSIPATLLRDGAKRDEVIRDVYVIALDQTDVLAVSVRNTYYAVVGDPVVPGADAVLEKTLGSFRLTQEPVKDDGAKRVTVYAAAYESYLDPSTELSDRQRELLADLPAAELPREAVELSGFFREDCWRDTLIPLAYDAAADVTLYGAVAAQGLEGFGERIGIPSSALTDAGVVLRAGDKAAYYPALWQGNLKYGGNPWLAVSDFDGDGRDEAAFCVLVGTGTGVSCHDLHVIDLDTMERHAVDVSTLDVRFSYDPAAHTAAVFGGGLSRTVDVPEYFAPLEKVACGNVVDYAYRDGALTCTMALDFGQTIGYFAEVEAPVVWNGSGYVLGEITSLNTEGY